MGDATTNPQRFRFSAARRLKRSVEFERVRRDGQTVRGSLLMLGVLRLEGEAAFLAGFVTSRRIGRAVVRNRVRRRMREVVRRNQSALVDGVWLVVIARPAAAKADFGALEKEWRRLAQRAGLVRDTSDF
jgi:ribonuclease P protein component